MIPDYLRAFPAAVVVIAAGCGRAPTVAPTSLPAPVPTAVHADTGKFTAADVHFLSGMIMHHAQAIVMARMATTHGASASIQTLSGRIINAQRDEIALMQQWLREHGQPVPDPFAAHTHNMADMPGMQHDTLMPGMLTAAQLDQLDAARGAEFDQLFLKFMIQHHEGAVSMVKDLFGTEGAAQDDMVFKLASDVNVDQTTEIARMRRMLADLLFGKGNP